MSLSCSKLAQRNEIESSKHVQSLVIKFVMSEENTEEKPEQAPVLLPQNVDAKTKQDSVNVECQQKEEEEEKTEEHEEEMRQQEEVTKAIEKNKKTPPKTHTTNVNRMPKQEMSVAKRKLEILQNDPASRKNKKARVSATSIKSKKDTKKTPTKQEFSFARPTASSASRTAAVVKATPTPPPIRKPSYTKKSPALTQRLSTHAPKTPVIANKASRSKFNYTPYTGPLPPLTVQSSFAPKDSRSAGHGVRTGTKVVRKAEAKPVVRKSKTRSGTVTP
ncbi:uncharacterized protein PHALS_06357 [Plasmopara halstedii]|uniref:Uncharacterized protein n=1 Tax=Plasmopara halstedii TaxID=4781 RepID=A0A0N7L806_PLAHL|nr:uncharacterized protein PHALS_06357 [Plasmopara halstedii]CEG48539.1 hypothetical protein PHALS_06357 [Plasmopara halstedii]|eukprot:XP_024584908.1 hypothetical protein PHALS_06357 [Plasmopara halstedii]